MTPLEHLHAALAETSGPDTASAAAVAERAGSVLRPAGAFTRLDQVAVWLAGWQRRPDPLVRQPAVVIFGGDHGVVHHSVSAYPAEITGAMAAAITGGVATSSALAAGHGASMTFVDVGVGKPTRDFTVEDAMSVDRFAESWFAGVDAVADLETDLLIVGELGIGNTTAAAAVSAGLFGGAATDWVGRGTGVDDEGLRRKQEVVEAGLARLAIGDASPLEVLRRLGGTELAAMAGAVAEARRRSIPVLLDGFIATAAIATLDRAVPGALDHALAGHCSAEKGHRRLLNALDKQPLLDLDLRLGEASGALVALPVVVAAGIAVTKVATFAEVEMAGPAGS